jgi:hypothetical protein
MFRLIKLKPPHGWNAVAWELAIVTLGVLLALAVQQWAVNREMHDKVQASKAALRDELSEHYEYAVEFRTVYPCIQAQLRRLRDHVLASGPVMNPIPTYKEQNFQFVLRFPNKVDPTDAWDAAVSDGLNQRFESAFRRQLAGHYAQIPQIRALISSNDDAEQGLAALTHRLPLDPALRFSIIERIERLRGRTDTLDLYYGQQIEYIQKVEMLPAPERAQALTERHGTYKFCKAQGLPMRSFEDAIKPVPN